MPYYWTEEQPINQMPDATQSIKHTTYKPDARCHIIGSKSKVEWTITLFLHSISELKNVENLLSPESNYFYIHKNTIYIHVPEPIRVRKEPWKQIDSPKHAKSIKSFTLNMGNIYF